MNSHTSEIKDNLYKLIVETDDEVLLNKVTAYFNSLKCAKADWWDTVSAQEKEAISIGLRQLDNGDRIPHCDVKTKADKLLGRR